MAKSTEPSGLELQLGELVAEIRRAFAAPPREIGRYRNPHDRGAEYDRLDRKEGHWLGLPHYILHWPGLIDRSRLVPGRAAEYGEDDAGEFALIECPCGAKPIARAEVEKCPGCERWYVLLAKGAVVIYGEMEPPPIPVVD